MSNLNLQHALRKLLLQRGVISAKEGAQYLAVSQPTFARLVRSMIDEILITGSARTTRYALRRELSGVGAEIPIYIVTEKGATTHLADLLLVKPKGYFVRSHGSDVVSRYYEDIPYWLDDLRPSGFLGRLIPRRYPELGYTEDIRYWNADECLHYWATLGWDLIGNIIIGKRAFELATENRRSPHTVVNERDRHRIYTTLAKEVVALGAAGSSAAGEQPKFLSVKAPEATPVLVKFSPIGNDEIHLRRRDLLVCEHLCLETLADSEIEVASSQLIFSSKQVFLELERFDRIGLGGRRGLITLHAFDMEHVGSGGSWRDIARGLLKRGIISEQVCQAILWRNYFGGCIGNTDMHAGNISFFVSGEKIQGLAPVYDMLPMIYAPRYEEIVPVVPKLPPLLPGEEKIWKDAAMRAAQFWGRVEKDKRVSKEMRRAAGEWEQLITKSV